MATIYRETIEGLLRTIARYRDGEIELAQLKSAIWEGSQVIVSAEERALRDELQRAEGNLDMIQFTTEPQDSEVRIDEIIVAIEERLRTALM